MGKHMCYTALFLFLSLSAGPVDAARREVVTQNVQISVGASSSDEALWGSTHEERCARWQVNFEARTAEVHDMVQGLNDGGALKTAQAVMKLRSMTRVYERAARRECQWVLDRDVDTSSLQKTASEGLKDNVCFPQAQALMTHEWATGAEQVRAMNVATQMLTSKQCEETDLKRMVEEMDNERSESDSTVEEQLDAASQDADDVTDEFVESLTGEDASLIQQREGSNFIVYLQELVALVAFLLIWAVLCIVFIPVIIMVVGAVLCTLAWVLRRFLRGNPGSLGGCMNWWVHQTEVLFAPGNELATAGACLLAGYFGALPHVHASFPHLGIYIRR